MLLLFGLLILIILLPGTSQAQFSHQFRSKNLVIEGRLYYGWTLDQHIEMTYFKRHYPSFEVSLMKATYGINRWEYMYNYPYIGIAAWYSDLGNTGVLGSAYSVFPYINFPLYHKKAFTFHFRLGVGIGYLTNPYQRYENYKNLAIGSHINGAVNLTLEGRWRLGKRFMTSIGLSWMHFSNGSIKTPNYGLNIPCATVSLAYWISKENPYLRRKLLPELKPFEFDGKKTIQIDISGAFAVKDMQAQLGVGNTYFVGTVFGNVMKSVSYKSDLGFGFDVSYDGSDEQILDLKGIPYEHEIQLVKTGLNVAYELSFSKMAIMLNVGGYLSGLDQSDGFIYEKLAFRYYVMKNIFASITLKAHYARADFIGFGLGYKFNIRYYTKR